jgi:hypothetical protein
VAKRWLTFIAVATAGAVFALAAGLAGCGSSSQPPVKSTPQAPGGIPQGRPQVVQPTAGQQGVVVAGNGSGDPIGDPNAHAPSDTEIRAELRQELVAAQKTSATYINPLRYVSVWERTDQGVDAIMPVGAPILAPCRIKILAIEPNWYAGQPLVYWELLEGPDAGRVQFVAEQITAIAPPGSILQQGQPIARFAPSGTAIEFGWATPNGVTLARATTGYEEGHFTPAGSSIRAWLNALGAGAGPDRH